MIRFVPVVAAAFLLLGCFGADFGDAALQQASSGFIGCRSTEIEIANDEPGFNQRSWDATCRRHLFHCFAGARGSVSCVEDMDTRATADRSRSSGAEAVR